jgi:hypothetical protein
MRVEWNSVACESLGVLRARGAEVVPFLQGQLSNDVALLDAARTLLAGYHNPQGRAIAVLRLVQLAADDIIALLPRELMAVVISRLAKYILRAKVRLADESTAWHVTGLIAPEAPLRPYPPFAAALPAAAGAVARVDGALAVRVAEQPPRWLLVSAAPGRAALAECAPAEPVVWKRLAIAAGDPQVYAATSEEFVAQMLNLDVLGAIAFDKGCYTGQEVIARAHYRGRVKRRLQRFVTRAALALKAGDSGTLGDGRSFTVVDSAPLADGRCEFLAVAPLGESEPGLSSDAAGRGERVSAQTLPLPYALPL